MRMMAVLTLLLDNPRDLHRPGDHAFRGIPPGPAEQAASHFGRFHFDFFSAEQLVDGRHEIVPGWFVAFRRVLVTVVDAPVIANEALRIEKEDLARPAG